MFAEESLKSQREWPQQIRASPGPCINKHTHTHTHIWKSGAGGNRARRWESRVVIGRQGHNQDKVTQQHVKWLTTVCSNYPLRNPPPALWVTPGGSNMEPNTRTSIWFDLKWSCFIEMFNNVTSFNLKIKIKIKHKFKKYLFCKMLCDFFLHR